MDIKEARKQIDNIDTVLVGEFEKRLSLIKEIGKYKDEHHLPLVDEERDVSIIAMHRSNCKDESLANYVENYMKTIVSMSNDYLKENMHKHIFLIGMPGAGKTTVGKVFTEYEYTTIKELIHNKPSVIATGGGTVTYDKTVNLMRNNGLVVFVNRDVNHILDDLDLEIRPLVKESIEYIFNVYEERYPLYEEVAHIKIGNEGSITDAVQEIIEALPNTEK